MAEMADGDADVLGRSVGVEDMITMSDLTESALVDNLRLRFQANQIYSSVGSILVSVNPYKVLPIYTLPVVKKYVGQRVGALPPHLFAVAEDCFSSMVADVKNQSVIISGESGAGKSESTKMIMAFLSARSGKQTLVERKMLESNPILEAFGNATTVRNDNSSRFGKFMAIRFNEKAEICGGRITQYLLEKSRIVYQAEGERNYHVFYQLLAAPQADKERLSLGRPSDYWYVNQSGLISLPHVDDAQGYDSLCSAINTLGFSSNDRDKIFTILAAILHLGNVKFKKSGDPKKDDSVPEDPAAVQRVSSMLGCPAPALQKALVVRTNIIRGEKFEVALTVAEASSNRDALAKYMYGTLFSWLVDRINVIIAGRDASNSIGVLDIFGFENFKVNSFEQFNINFTNEKLQQFFNQRIFKQEQEEYTSEGINWASIKFKDNQECVDLIEKPMGVISLLDEECRFPKGSDATLLEKLHTQHSKHPHYEAPRISKTSFVVKHYAGPVIYEISGFLPKNKDTTQQELLDLLQQSSDQFVADVFKPALEEESSQSKPGTMRKKGAGTVAVKFKEQLQALVDTLTATVPHYVRCIKPNMRKQANTWEEELVTNQLKYAGMMETVRIRQLGYPFRWPFAAFFQRYRALAFIGETGNDHKRNCQQLLQALKLEADMWQIGKTKVFMKDSQRIILEEKRNVALRGRAVLIQSNWRAYYYRKQFLRKRRLIVRSQAKFRSYDQQIRYTTIRRNMITVQACYRRHVVREAYKKLRAAVLHFQKVWRFNRQQKMLQAVLGRWREEQAALRASAAAERATSAAEEKKRLVAAVQKAEDDQRQAAARRKSVEMSRLAVAKQLAEESERAAAAERQRKADEKARELAQQRLAQSQALPSAAERRQMLASAAISVVIDEDVSDVASAEKSYAQTLEMLMPPGTRRRGSLGESRRLSGSEPPDGFIYGPHASQAWRVSLEPQWADTKEALRQLEKDVANAQGDVRELGLEQEVASLERELAQSTLTQKIDSDERAALGLAEEGATSKVVEDSVNFGALFGIGHAVKVPKAKPFVHFLPHISKPNDVPGLETCELPGPLRLDDYGLPLPCEAQSAGIRTAPDPAAQAARFIGSYWPPPAVIEDAEAENYGFGAYAMQVFRRKKGTKHAELLSWSKSIKAPLLDGLDPDTAKLAEEIGRKITSYMGKKCQEPTQVAKFILRKGLSNEGHLAFSNSLGLREEIFAQLMKQVTNNPSADSTTKGWELLKLCTSTFAPLSLEFTRHLTAFFIKAADASEGDLSKRAVREGAKFALYALRRSLQSGNARAVPSAVSFAAILSHRCSIVRIQLVDGSEKGFYLDSASTGAETRIAMKHRLGLTSPEGYTLFAVFNGLARRVPDSGRIIDAIALSHYLQLAHTAKNKPFAFKFEFRRSCFIPIRSVFDDDADLRLTFHQAWQEYLSSDSPVTVEEAAEMSACAMQLEVGDYPQEPEAYHKYLPKALAYYSELRPAEWKARMRHYHQLLSGHAQQRVQQQFLGIVSHRRLYGAMRWEARASPEGAEFLGLSAPYQCTLAVNHDGVHFIDDKPAAMKSFAFNSLASWNTEAFLNMISIKFNPGAGVSELGVTCESGTDVIASIDEHVAALRKHTEFFRAIKEHMAVASGMLSFARGAIIRVLERGGSRWWVGEIDGVQGSFPADFVEPQVTPAKVPARPSPLSASGEARTSVLSGSAEGRVLSGSGGRPGTPPALTLQTDGSLGVGGERRQQRRRKSDAGTSSPSSIFLVPPMQSRRRLSMSASGQSTTKLSTSGGSTPAGSSLGVFTAVRFTGTSKQNIRTSMDSSASEGANRPVRQTRFMQQSASAQPPRAPRLGERPKTMMSSRRLLQLTGSSSFDDVPDESKSATDLELIVGLRVEKKPRKLFGSSAKQTKLMAFSSDPIKESLLELPSTLNKLARGTFVLVMKYMGDYPSKGTPEFRIVQELCQTLFDTPALTEEVFCQVLKQITGHPRKEAVYKGWEMLTILCGCFTVSARLEKPLRSFLFQTWNDKDAKAKQFAQICLDRTKDVATLGPRQCPPSTMEHMSIQKLQRIVSLVYLLDGTTKAAYVSSNARVKEIAQQLGGKLGLHEEHGFGLYQQAPDDDFPVPLPDEDYLCDHIATWDKLSPMRTGGFGLVFKQRLPIRTDIDEGLANTSPQAVNMIYSQVVADIHASRLVVPEALWPQLVALQVFGRLKATTNVVRGKANFVQYLPQRDRPRGMQLDEWFNRAETAMGQPWDPLDARLELLKMVKTLPMYGSSVFDVMFKDAPMWLVVSFSGIGVHRRFEQEPSLFWSHEQVGNYGSSARDEFHLLTDNLMKPVKHSFIGYEAMFIGGVVDAYRRAVDAPSLPPMKSSFFSPKDIQSSLRHKYAQSKKS